MSASPDPRPSPRRPTAFLGSFCYGWPGVTGTPAVAQFELCRDDYGPLLDRLGCFRSPDGPNVAIVACARPVHPLTHVDVLTEGLARGLADLLETRTAAPTLALLRQLGRLSDAVGATLDRWQREISAPPAGEA